MNLTNQSPTVDFYRTAIDTLLLQMGLETEEKKIDELHGQVMRLTSRMADTAFADINNRTPMLKALASDLRRITAGSTSSGTTGNWSSTLVSIAALAEQVVGGARTIAGAIGGSPANPILGG